MALIMGQSFSKECLHNKEMTGFLFRLEKMLGRLYSV